MVDTVHGDEKTLTERLGPYSFIQGKKGLRTTQDPFILADFVLPLERHDSVLDIGTGTGVIPLLLAWKSEVESIKGVEIERDVAEIAKRNVYINGLASRIEIIEGDYRALPSIYQPCTFSCIVSNPPYLRKGEGRRSPLEQRAIAREEIMGGFEDLARVTDHLLTPEGRMACIYPFRRLDEVISGFERNGLKPVRIRFVYTSSGKEPKLFLVEVRRKGRLVEESPLFL